MPSTVTADPTATSADASKQETYVLPNEVDGLELGKVKIDDIIIPDDRHKRRSREKADQLGESMEELGLDTPLLLSPAPAGKYVLVAGGGRLEQAKAQGWTEIHGIIKVRTAKQLAASTAAENMAREDLSPAEEADALEAMLKAGHDLREAAKKVGLTQTKGTLRLPLIEVPEEIRAAFHHGGLPPSVAQLVKELYDGNHEIGLAIGRLGAKNPGSVYGYLSRGMSEILGQLPRLYRQEKMKGKPPFVVPFRRGWSRELALHWDTYGIPLKGKAAKWFREQVAAVRYADEAPKIVFSEEDLDQAVAVGVAYHTPGEEGDIWIHDRAWLTAHVNDIVLPRMHKEWEAKSKAAEKTKKTSGSKASLADADPADLAPKLGRKFKKDLQPTAHHANTDLGRAIVMGLEVKEITRDLALFLAHETLGKADRHARKYDESALRIAECAARVMDGWYTIERWELKSGEKRWKAVYLEGADAEKKMWDYINAAKTPLEIIQRALHMHAAALAFRRECGADGREPRAQAPENTVAAKALAKIVKPVIPATMKRMDREIRQFNPTEEAEKQIAEAKAERDAEVNDEQAGGATVTDTAKAKARRGSQSAQAVKHIKAAPGITIPALAAKMEVKQHTLYKLLPALESEGKIAKSGRGWFAAGAEPQTLAQAA